MFMTRNKLDVKVMETNLVAGKNDYEMYQTNYIPYIFRAMDVHK